MGPINYYQMAANAREVLFVSLSLLRPANNRVGKPEVIIFDRIVESIAGIGLNPEGKLRLLPFMGQPGRHHNYPERKTMFLNRLLAIG